MRSADLVKIDVTSKKMHVYEDVDIGFVARKAIADCRGLLDGQKMAFRTECFEFLTKMTSKLIERCPKNYKVVRSISCLVPSTILNNRTLSEKIMDTLLQILHDSNNVRTAVADKAIRDSSLNKLCSTAQAHAYGGIRLY